MLYQHYSKTIQIHQSQYSRRNQSADTIFIFYSIFLHYFISHLASSLAKFLIGLNSPEVNFHSVSKITGLSLWMALMSDKRDQKVIQRIAWPETTFIGIPPQTNQMKTLFSCRHEAETISRKRELVLEQEVQFLSQIISQSLSSLFFEVVAFISVLFSFWMQKLGHSSSG